MLQVMVHFRDVFEGASIICVVSLAGLRRMQDEERKFGQEELSYFSNSVLLQL